MQTHAAFRIVAIAACIVATFCSGAADAAPRRSNAARKKKKMEDQAYMQLEMMRYQSEMAAKQREIYQSFDKDGDGKLSPPEKSSYDRHLRDIEKGNVQNPFALIAPVGQGPRPKSPIDELKEKATQYQAGIIAKQQEIVQQFDENGDGELKGLEKSKFDKYMHEVQTGKVPDPFATVGTAAGSGK